MDLQYQLRATCYICELPEINGKFVRTAGCDLKVPSQGGVGKPLHDFWGRALVHRRSLMACDTMISSGFPLTSSLVGLCLHSSIQGWANPWIWPQAAASWPCASVASPHQQDWAEIPLTLPLPHSDHPWWHSGSSKAPQCDSPAL